MPVLVASVLFAALPLTCAALVLASPIAAAQTATEASQGNEASSGAADTTHELQLKGADELYILKDLPEPKDAEPKLDLGKVGKKGKLSLERMPLDQPDTYEGEPETRGRAGGVRLKIPLGKQAH
jgi:hypothetical protein